MQQNVPPWGRCAGRGSAGQQVVEAAKKDFMFAAVPPGVGAVPPRCPPAAISNSPVMLISRPPALDARRTYRFFDQRRICSPSCRVGML
jgi:hypothetical protein